MNPLAICLGQPNAGLFEHDNTEGPPSQDGRPLYKQTRPKL